MQVLYINQSQIKSWTTFLLTKKYENVLNVSKLSPNAYDVIRTKLYSKSNGSNIQVLYINGSQIENLTTLLLTKKSENVLNVSKLSPNVYDVIKTELYSNCPNKRTWCLLGTWTKCIYSAFLWDTSICIQSVKSNALLSLLHCSHIQF